MANEYNLRTEQNLRKYFGFPLIDFVFDLNGLLKKFIQGSPYTRSVLLISGMLF